MILRPMPAPTAAGTLPTRTWFGHVPDDSPSSLLPVDRVLSFYNLILGVALIPLAAEPRAGWLVLAHGIGFLLPILLARCRPPCHPLLQILREVYPLLCLALFWHELGVRYSWVNTMANDHLMATLDRLIFGFQPSIEWRPLPAVSEIVSAWYGSYYLLLGGIPLMVLAKRQRPATRELIFRLSLTYLTCFLIYVLFPVAGPREFFSGSTRAVDPGLFHLANDFIRSIGDSLGTAFPSSHVAGSVTLAWIAWRYCPAPIALVSLLLAAGMTAAVVYTGNHFVVDSAAAVIVAVAVQGVLVPVLHRRWAGSLSLDETVARSRLGANPAEAQAT